MPSDQQARLWRHLTRGTVYTEVGRAELQHSLGRPPQEGDRLVIYRGEDGRLWARAEAEFEDGRFERVQPAPCPTKDSPPDWDDLRGRAPGATGGLSSEDFVRGLRDEWD